MDKIQDIMVRWNALQPLSDRERELLSRRFTIVYAKIPADLGLR